MKFSKLTQTIVLTVFALLIGIVGSASATAPRMMNIQGLITDALGVPIKSGTVDLTFRIYNNATSTTTLLWSETVAGVTTNPRGIAQVRLGLVTPLTASVFDDAMRYLEIQVNLDPPITPRMRLVSVPYSLHSAKVETLDGADGGMITGPLSITGELSVDQLKLPAGATEGHVLTSDASGNASWSASAAAGGSYWELDGNEGTTSSNFVGTTDSTDFRIKVNNRRILKARFSLGSNSTWRDDRSPNLIFGNPHNNISNSELNGVTIGGGGSGNDVSEMKNYVNGSFGTISGGEGNRAGGRASVGGGTENKATGDYATIPGGWGNTVSGDYASAAMGRHATVTHSGSFLWSSGSTASSTNDNQFKIVATNGVVIGGENNGLLRVKDETETIRVTLKGETGQVRCFDQDQISTINLNGETGIVECDTVETCVLKISGGCDLAEPFEMSSGEEYPLGSVVVIDDENPGHVKIADSPYDQKVAGVISGANGVNPGLTLSQNGVMDEGQLVALTGRVYVRASSINGAIKPGDLLTTSSVEGLAMKATDREKSHGTVIGKAMTALSDKEGLVLVLVNLQ